MTEQYKLEDLLMGGPGLDGYTYNADVYCVECGKDICCELWERRERKPINWMDFCDSEQWPSPIFFGESPEFEQYCGDCGTYMYGESEES